MTNSAVSHSRASSEWYRRSRWGVLCHYPAAPPSVEGKSLLPAMRDPGQKVRYTLYFAYTDKHRAVKNRRHKLIEYVVNGKHSMTQLFDLAEDPWELRNLAADPAHAQTRDLLRAEMARYRDAWDDAASPWGETFWRVLRPQCP